MKKGFALVLLFSLLFLPIVHGLAIGVSPSKFVIEDALKGEQYQRSMRFSTTANEDVVVNLEAHGDYKDWVKFYDSEDTSIEITNLNIEKKGESFALAVFDIPDDTPNGEYEIQIAANKITESSEDVGTGSSVTIKTFSIIKILVTGNQILEGDVRSITANDVESGYPLRVKVDFQNTGNVKAQPKIELMISQDGEKITDIVSSDSGVGVNQIEIIDVEWDTSGRGVGDFDCNVKVYLGGELLAEEDLGFTVLKSGTHTAEGRLGDVNNPKDVMVGTLSKFEVEFFNSGDVDVKAKLVGEVYLNGNLLDRLEGDEVLVGPSERESLSAYYKPEKTGDYAFKNSVMYSGKELPLEDFSFKLTEEGMVISSVGGGSSAIMWTIIILAIMIVVIVLVLAIKYL